MSRTRVETHGIPISEEALLSVRNGLIYKMWHASDPNTIYVGSTKSSLSKRLSQHKSHAKERETSKIFKYIREKGADGMRIEGIEQVEFQTAQQLRQREDHYIRESHEKCFNDTCGNHFLTYLMNYKALDCADVKNMPQTELRKDIQQVSKMSYALFIDYFTEQLECEVEDRADAYKNISGEITGESVYKFYKQWADDNGLRGTVSAVKFGLYMKEKYERKRTKKGMVYVLP